VPNFRGLIQDLPANEEIVGIRVTQYGNPPELAQFFDAGDTRNIQQFKAFQTYNGQQMRTTWEKSDYKDERLFEKAKHSHFNSKDINPMPIEESKFTKKSMSFDGSSRKYFFL
jgi:hypothetical protein